MCCGRTSHCREVDAHSGQKAVNKASDFSVASDKFGSRKGQHSNSSSWPCSSTDSELLDSYNEVF